MSDTDKEAQVASEAQGEKKGGFPKIIVFILLAVVLAGGGFVGFRILGAGKSTEKELKVGHEIILEEFLVNLSDGRTFLKTQIALGIAEGAKFGKEGGDGHGGGGDPPKVRDAVLMILSSQDAKTLETAEGKEHLKQQIIVKLNSLLNDSIENQKSADKPTDSPKQDLKSEEPNRGPVLEVYLINFTMQRT